ncbi:hypothetical protein CC86DRAFT_14534 [Ophiobolus disseminans]|uniref:Uncharacterized protein n=1 Tax=Ophiobolus disseminans TaxID=1469910 RepID=A0A6A7AKR1_9PLEO|nr:hypothetical protein CC86DRAFT_14534 [Ophiobolus disseminans]
MEIYLGLVCKILSLSNPSFTFFSFCFCTSYCTLQCIPSVKAHGTISPALLDSHHGIPVKPLKTRNSNSTTAPTVNQSTCSAPFSPRAPSSTTSPHPSRNKTSLWLNFYCTTSTSNSFQSTSPTTMRTLLPSLIAGTAPQPTRAQPGRTTSSVCTPCAKRTTSTLYAQNTWTSCSNTYARARRQSYLLKTTFVSHSRSWARRMRCASSWSTLCGTMRVRGIGIAWTGRSCRVRL